MPTESQELKEHLQQTDPEFRELFTTHRQLDDRLLALESKSFLTDGEQLEEVTIKKRKLQLKDRMEDIIRRYRHAGSAAQG
jgi:uncharacterized protein YdcH (DUF465 family)